MYDKHPGLHLDGPSPFSLERMLRCAGLTRDPSAVPGTMGKVSFVALTALGRGEGRVRAAGEGVPLKRRRTMCEKPRLWVSHTDHYVPPTPLGERQRRRDQPTADPALIGFFFFFHCALKGRKSFCGVKGEAFLPFPSLELIGCVTRWPNPSGLMRGRPGPERGRLSPPLRARERVWRPGEGRGPRDKGGTVRKQ